MKKQLIALALAAITAAGSAQAAELSIADYSLVPDGTEIGSLENDTDSQVTQLNTSTLGVPVLTAANPSAYLVTTMNFGTDTSADMSCNFLASGKQRRLGVQVTSAGLVRSIGSGSDITAADLGSMSGQSVTVIAKFVYGAGTDSMALWVNPTIASLESTPDGSLVWNSNSFYFLRQRIDNNSTPATAGTSSIVNTTILTDADATFVNALVAAGVEAPPSGGVDAALSTVSASPASVLADGTLTSTITVTLRDSEGISVTGKTVTLANTAGPGTPTINPASATSDLIGAANFTVSSTTVGTEVFTATADSVVINNTASVAFTSTLTDGTNSTVEASLSTIPANGVTKSLITVTLQNDAGLPLPGKLVSLAGDGSATVAPAGAGTDTTNANGVATFTVSSTTIGIEEFTASCDTDTLTLTADTVNVDFFLAGSATITWTGSDITDDVANISTNGTLVDARNGTLATAVTVNEVNFEGSDTSGNLFDSLFANDGIGSRGGGTTVTDTTYRSFLAVGQRSGRFGFNTPPRMAPTQAWATVEFSGLTVGNTYEIQIWASDVSVGTLDGKAQTKVLVLGNGSVNAPVFGTDAQLFYEVVDGGAGQYGIGKFVANADNQTFNVQTYVNLDTTPAGGSGDHFSNGWQIRDLGVVAKAVITDFEAAGATGVIDQDAKTIAVEVPFGTSLSTLAPTFILSSGTCDQTSGAIPSPSFAAQNPVDYVVTDTSTDPATANTYSVTVNVADPVGTLVIDLGTSPTGTFIEGGQFIGSGPTNLPLPTLPAGSILRSIEVDAVLESSDNGAGLNYASDLAVLLDPTPETPGGDFSLEITSGVNKFGGSVLLGWPASAAAVPVAPLADTKTDADWIAAGDIDLSSTGLFLGNSYVDGEFVAGQGGVWSGTITLTYDLPSGGSGYSSWAGVEPFDGDKNADGVSNGIAFLLGAADPDADATGLLPTSMQSGGLVLTFSCLNAANRGASTLRVEHSSDLGISDAWIGALVPDTAGVSGPVNGVTFDVTLGDPLNSVTATIPVGEAAGGKHFGRLSGTE